MTPSNIRALVRWAYGDPKKAGACAKGLEVYPDFIYHMIRVHQRLVGIFYRRDRNAHQH